MSLKPQPIEDVPLETARVARAAFPKGSVVMRLRDEFGSLYQDEDFQALFPKRGQPGLAPWRLALVTVLQFMENLSDRAAADAVRSRIDWKYALGLELTDPGFHFSVLSEFRTRLIDGQAETLVLDKMLVHFKEHGFVKARGKQRTDSTHVLAAVHDLHLCELVGETLRATLNDLAAVAPEWLRGVGDPTWYERYARRIEDYRLPKSDAGRKDYALQVGYDGFALLDALEAEHPPSTARELPMIATLRLVWSVHYGRQKGKVRWTPAKELPPVGERIQSPYDPEMHYSTKRSVEWSGYKVHITETCDEDTVHVITDVLTCAAQTQDMSSTADIHARLADKELLPAEHFVDAGYTDAGLLAKSQREHSVTLTGPVRGNSSWQAREATGYDASYFIVDWEHQKVTCPQGKESVTWQPSRAEDGTPRIATRFSRSDCGVCSARELCTRAKVARRVVYLHVREEYEALRATRAHMQDPAWKQRYHVRAGIEGTLSQGVRSFGLRRSRYIGLAKTGLQEILTATGMNVLRMVNWLEGKPRAKTRISRFAALATT